MSRWRHSHAFGQDKKQSGEFRTFIVIAITSSMMLVEIVAGLAFGSMALLADGLHMGSHTIALSINAFAYVYARRNANNERYSFGTGKVNTLGGYTGAILLAVVASMMAWESVERLIAPISIAFNQAIIVAVLGLVVNGASVFILGINQGHGHEHHRHDHNLRSAYFHVLADAITSLLAIFALLVGKYFGAVWMDSVMGVVGAALVARWSLGLLKSTGVILLDQQSSKETQDSIRKTIENDDNRIVDLHLWAVGPDIYSAVISIVSRFPQQPEYYKSLLANDLTLDHVSIEVHEYEEN